MSTFVITQEEQDDINRRAMMKLREYLDQPTVAAAEAPKALPENPKDIASHGRAPLDLIPAVSEIAVSMALADGAKKYGPFNWRKDKVQVCTYIGAMKRHLAAFMDGEDFASDSGCHHLAHVAAGCAILLDAIALGQTIDNRPPAGAGAGHLRAVIDGKNPFNQGQQV